MTVVADPGRYCDAVVRIDLNGKDDRVTLGQLVSKVTDVRDKLITCMENKESLEDAVRFANERLPRGIQIYLE